MSVNLGKRGRERSATLFAWLACLMLCVGPSVSHAGFFQTNAVGGVMVNAEGILRDAVVDDQVQFARHLAEVTSQAPEDLDKYTDFRKVSLKRLQEHLEFCQKNARPIPDEVRFLGGLQAIRYVIVLPEHNDVLLVGPAEGWKVNDRGFFVGKTTGRPVMLFDDLVVALRSAERAARGGISCSIDPNKDGLAKLQRLVGQLRTIGNPQQTLAALERSLGPQTISVNNVPATSHFARVLVAADFEMKRLGMGFDKSPVKGLPSYLEMAQASGRGLNDMMPRWWMAPKYDALLRDNAGLTWELRGASVQCETETDFLAAGGGRKVGGGKADNASQKWADAFTEKFDELAIASPIFGELRNVMDLAVVAALITKEDLLGKASLNLSYLQADDFVAPAEMPAPRQVDSKASFVKRGGNYLISVSGGVQLNSYAVASRTENSDSLGGVRSKMIPQGSNWWWD